MLNVHGLTLRGFWLSFLEMVANNGKSHREDEIHFIDSFWMACLRLGTPVVKCYQFFSFGSFSVVQLWSFLAVFLIINWEKCCSFGRKRWKTVGAFGPHLTVRYTREESSHLRSLLGMLRKAGCRKIPFGKHMQFLVPPPWLSSSKESTDSKAEST